MAYQFLVRLGGRLRLLRVVQGWTQEQVAQRAGITSKHLSLVENGKRNVPMTTVAAIIERGLQTTLAHVFGGMEDPPPGEFLLTETALASIAPDQREAVSEMVRMLLRIAR
jgi:transcriptional regulator with XRE-family HTH domain